MYLLLLLCVTNYVLLVEGFSIYPARSRASTITSLRAAPELSHRQDDNNNHKTKQKKFPRGSAPNRKTALIWVVQSIERIAEDPELSLLEKPSPQLLDALYRLQRARTQGQVVEAGRLLESLDVDKESVEIQERVIKALSISGLLSLALNLLAGLIEEKTMPSDIAYIAVCNGLRKAGRVRRLEQLLYQLGSIASDDSSVSVIALNIYLAALCNKIEDQSRLEHARDWLTPGVSRERLGGTDPDASSYSTVLNAAASVGNHRLVEELWKELTGTRKLLPTIYAYNALLRSVQSGPDGNARALDVFDQLLKEVQPDRYTIDLVLVPLVRANRIGDIEALLGNFVDSQSVDARTASNAFSSFLSTLVKAGELPTARALFDTYLLPSLSFSGPAKIIQPTTRHFNVLIDGYKHVSETNRTGAADEDGDLEEKSLVGSLSIDSLPDRTCEARDNGRELYNTMLEAGIPPDYYTLTSMLGIASTSKGVTNLYRQAVIEYSVQATPAVARAVITAYGKVGDPSSACIAFDELASGTMNARTWNALLSALARNVMLDGSAVIHVDSSTSAFALVDSSATNILERGVCGLVDGLSCCDSIRRIVALMESNGDKDVGISRAPHPNSQTFCISAAALQTGSSNSELAMELFRNATRYSVSSDGRFINALFRCFGDDIDSALSAWKGEIRQSCLAHEHRRRASPPSSRRRKGKNLVAAYHGLLYVCGRALRPDIAVRLVYAMNKEELKPNEVALNCYRSGKRAREQLAKLNARVEEKSGIGLAMSKQYESILLVECTTYDRNDKRREGEKRLRIII